MKKFTAAIVLALATLPVAAGAQGLGIESDSVVLAALWDADSGSFTYCNTLGATLTSVGRNKPSPAGSTVSTSGSSTTLTATAAGYANVAVGDPLWINDNGVMLRRVVTARASSTSVTINAAVTVSAAPWEYRTRVCGTADTSGAVVVSGFRDLTFQINLSQETSTSTDYQVECRVFGPATVWQIMVGPTNDTSTFGDIIAVTIGFDECRVGVKVNTDDGGDTGVDAEQFTILLGRRR